MSQNSNPLLTLCDAASLFEKRDASPSHKPNSDSWIQIAVNLGAKDSDKINMKNVESKQDPPKISNQLLNSYIENTSDEIRKRFSFKCKYSPNKCSVTVKSYGSGDKAFSKMKKHVLDCHIMKKLGQNMEKIPSFLDNTCKFIKRFRSVKTAKPVFERSSRGKSISKEATEKEEKILMVTHLEADDDKNLGDTSQMQKFGQLDHDYARSENEPSANNPPVDEAKQNTIPLQLSETCRQSSASESKRKHQSRLDKFLSDSSYTPPSTIPPAPFPFVYVPEPNGIGVAQILEFHSNGDPVKCTVQSAACRILSKTAMQNKRSRKRSKIARMFNLPRPVLECLENRVACQHSASSEQGDGLALDNSIENSENVEESIKEIALRNIQILKQHRKKRKCHEKPKEYVCEICSRILTANTSLSFHYMSHLNIKPYDCGICNKSFTRRHSLKYHMMIHTNETRFECESCKRLFRHPSHYREHMRKHTGEEPFSCMFCSNKFKTRNSYKRHLKMQHQKLLTSNGIEPICSVS